MADIAKGLTNRPFADFDRTNKPKPFQGFNPVSIRAQKGVAAALWPKLGKICWQA
ncbi:MAG: hypothetical protein KDJ66_00265 [Nitratireductor sp.]|nr:hypothetical protein [Nitratireductor sp.]